MRELYRFLKDERGTTAFEYAAIGLLIIVAIFGAIVLFGEREAGLYNNVASAAGNAL